MRARSVARLVFVAGVIMAGVPAAFAQTQGDRLRALEAKTDFYTKSIKKVALKYRKGDPTGLCQSERLSLDLEPAVSMVGISYAWLTVTLKYRGVRGSDRLFSLTWTPVQTAIIPCVAGADPLSTQAGTLTLKGYCSISVPPNDKIRVTIDLTNSEGTIDACQAVAAATLQLKLVNIGIHEPPD